MLKPVFKLCLPLGCFVLSASLATAQEVVHALAGTVSAVNPAAKTMTVDNSDGDGGLFSVATGKNAKIEIDKDLRADTTPASEFSKKGEEVVVFFVVSGVGPRTAIAVEDLGAGKLESDSGKVVGFDRRQHLLKIETKAGGSESFQIGDKTAVETSMGAVDGRRYDPEKGDEVQIICSSSNGTKDALFVGQN